ncbi:MAG TPA: amino acid permease [Terriglobales bacterium]|nr:amino acid permease [Terriglobales bacterium]
MAGTAPSGLVRAIGRWSLAALMVNSIIGSGVFGLPSEVARLVGGASPWAVLLAGAAVAIIMACFAEVASYFSEAGGPYLYSRVAFGRLVGIETGWMLWLARITAPAASANLFVTYASEFWPRATQAGPRLAILSLLIGVLALVNFRGVRGGAQVSNVFTVAKLAPLFAVALAGTAYLLAGHGVDTEAASAGGVSPWLKAMLLLVFAYGGFEGALTPMSEAKDPRRDAAFALFTALITCTLLYTLIQWAVIGILPHAAQAARPLADVARILRGGAGAILIASGALISIYGYLSANMLAVPRITFALAERGDFPSLFAAVHPRFRTPYVSIAVFALLTWLLALLGSFSWNVTLSAVARLFYYGLVCAALPVLRRREPAAARFRLPGGVFFALLGVGICLVLITQVNLSGSLILLATVLVAFFNWILVRGSGGKSS